MSTDIPKLYAEQEVAALFNISLATLRRQRQTGLLRGRKIGRKWLFTGDDITDYLERVRACKENDEHESASFGSQKDTVRIAGTSHGSTPDRDRLAASRLALKTFGKQK